MSLKSAVYLGFTTNIPSIRLFHWLGFEYNADDARVGGPYPGMKARSCPALGHEAYCCVYYTFLPRVCGDCFVLLPQKGP